MDLFDLLGKFANIVQLIMFCVFVWATVTLLIARKRIEFPFRTPLKNRRFLWDLNRPHKSRENWNNSQLIRSNSKKTLPFGSAQTDSIKRR